MISAPIMLGIVARISHEFPEADLVHKGSSKQRRRHIIALYVDTLLRRRSGRGLNPQPQDARRWLGWLATWMKRHGRTEFYVDRLPPAWLQDVTDIRALKAKPRYWLPLTWGAATGAQFLIMVLGGRTDPLGLMFNGLGVTFATSFHIRRHNSSLTEPIQLVWKMRGRWIVPILLVAPLTLGAVLFGAPEAARSGQVVHVLLWTLGATLVSIPAVLALTIAPTGMSNQAGLPPGMRLRRSRRTAGQGALLVGLPIAVAVGIVRSFSTGDLILAFGTAVPFAMICVPSCWLIFGGVPILQYRALFRELERNGRGPRDYLAFLDWASEHLLLQTSGSALRFPHKEIQRYLTELWPSTDTHRTAKSIRRERMSFFLRRP
jgi:hypothetical protein